MNRLEEALKNFEKAISQVSSSEIDGRLERLGEASYEGSTMNDLFVDSLDFAKYNFRTQINLFGWFNANAPYFRCHSTFFTESFAGDLGPIPWNPRPLLEEKIQSVIIEENPQNEFVGFLLA
ncbi:MAG: hypothetical protein U0X34_10870 [Bacteroidia bacterium]|jgi:hypothetical protein